MNTTRKQYDIIISEPSNPWIAGVASLFTAEFYDRAAEVLKPDGVFAQWIQLYELDPEDLRMVLYEVQRKFPEVSVWVTDSDLIIIAHASAAKAGHGTRRADRAIGSEHGAGFPRIPAQRDARGIAFVLRHVDRGRARSSPRKLAGIPTIIHFWNFMRRGSFSRIRAISTSNCCMKRRTVLLPQGAEVADLESAYAGMIEPFLFFKRTNLANQAMALLAQVAQERRRIASACDCKIESGLRQLRPRRRSAASRRTLRSKPESPLMAEKEELWGMLNEAWGIPISAKQHLRIRRRPIHASAASPQTGRDCGKRSILE